MSEQANLDQISALLPIDFFPLKIDLHAFDKKGLKKKHQLPHFDALVDENAFANVAIGWDFTGLCFQIDLKTPFKDCFFPDYRKGDSVELFIDTRDGKSARSVSRFCHHFLFLPQNVGGVQAQEITHFRGEERREHCPPEKIKLDIEFESRGYTYHIFIPSLCLYGYDPASFERLGFSYRINKVGKGVQHFALSSRYLAVEQQPSLWSTMEMKSS